MTEIPEHLLNRSKARKAELAGESAGAPAAPAAASSEVATRASAPAKTKAVPAPVAKTVEPDPVYVRAAKERRKIPFWAMSALAMLPVWTFLYMVALTPEEKVAAGPISTGTAVYGACAGCHGGNGAGGAGQVLYEGASLKTFPHIEDMLNFVYNGSQRYQAAGLKVYGNPEREGGPHVPYGYNKNPMPQQGEKAGGALSEYEILGVVCHIRYDISGADPASEEWAAEWENWCSPDSPIYPALKSGATTFDTLHEDMKILMPAPNIVGTEPRETTAR